MADLLPEQFSTASSPHPNSNNQVVVFLESSWETRRQRKCQITDMATWVKVYATYVLVLSSQFPETLPDLVSYEFFIVKNSKRFRYPSLLLYDVEYRKWAAIHRIRNWSTTNSELYSLAFMGQALVINWCPICQVEGGLSTVSAAYHQPSWSPTTTTISPTPSPQYSWPSRATHQAAHSSLLNKNGGLCPYGRDLLQVPACLLLLLWPTSSALLSQ